jgi:hypothetical protein
VADRLSGVPVMCCAWHDDHAFMATQTWRPDHSGDPSWGRQKANYLNSRLG